LTVTMVRVPLTVTVVRVPLVQVAKLMTGGKGGVGGGDECCHMVKVV
jgi:hypothetical protein